MKKLQFESGDIFKCEGCVFNGIKICSTQGGISAKLADANVLAFQSDPNIKVFIGHPESGGEGINLIQAPYTIVFSRTHSLKHSIQLEARNHRGGSEIHEKIVRYDIVAENTIDEMVADLVLSKGEMADEIYAELLLKNLLQSDSN